MKSGIISKHQLRELDVAKLQGFFGNRPEWSVLTSIVFFMVKPLNVKLC